MPVNAKGQNVRHFPAVAGEGVKCVRFGPHRYEKAFVKEIVKEDFLLEEDPFFLY